MMTHYSTEQLIEDLLTATYGNSVSERQKHVFRKALQGLVSLAKAEQMQALKMDVRKATEAPLSNLHHYYGEAD